MAARKGRQKSNKDDRRPTDHLNENDELRSRWKIIQKLGGGGMGQVYTAYDKKEKTKVAVKTETRGALQVLGLEKEILEAMTGLFTNTVLLSYDKKENTKVAVKIETRGALQVLRLEKEILEAMKGENNFCKLFGCGHDPEFNFVVMTLCDKDIAKIRREAPHGYLSFGTAARITTQSIVALEALHDAGYLHRDIKPENLTIGRGRDNRVVYLVDFGLAREYLRWTTDEKGQKCRKIKRCRNKLGFRGTVRYASRTIHNEEELGRVDDLWSLYYVFVELAVGELPWRVFETANRDETKRKVKEAKEAIESCDLIADMPETLTEVVKHLDSLSWSDTPNYSFIRDKFRKAMKALKADRDDEYDWENSYKNCRKPCPFKSPKPPSLDEPENGDSE